MLGGSLGTRRPPTRHSLAATAAQEALSLSPGGHAEAWRGSVTYPRSQSWLVSGSGSRARPSPFPVTGRCSARGRRWCPSLSPGRCHFPSTHPTPGLSSGPGRSLGTCFQYKRAVLPPPHKTATLGTYLLAGRDLGKHLAEVEASRVSVPARSPRLASGCSAPQRGPRGRGPAAGSLLAPPRGGSRHTNGLSAPASSS